MLLTEKHHQYWTKNLWITGMLLAVWFVVTFGSVYWVEQLNNFTLLGFPLGFYMAAQGALVVYCVVIWLYARIMNRLDEQYGVAEREE